MDTQKITHEIRMKYWMPVQDFLIVQCGAFSLEVTEHTSERLLQKTRRGTSSRTKKNPSKKSTESWRPSWHWTAASATGQAAAVSTTNVALLRFDSC